MWTCVFITVHFNILMHEIKKSFPDLTVSGSVLAVSLPGLLLMPVQSRSTQVSHRPTLIAVPLSKVLEIQNGDTKLTNSTARPRMARTKATRL